MYLSLFFIFLFFLLKNYSSFKIINVYTDAQLDETEMITITALFFIACFLWQCLYNSFNYFIIRLVLKIFFLFFLYLLAIGNMSLFSLIYQNIFTLVNWENFKDDQILGIFFFSDYQIIRCFTFQEKIEVIDKFTLIIFENKNLSGDLLVFVKNLIFKEFQTKDITLLSIHEIKMTIIAVIDTFIESLKPQPQATVVAVPVG
jgi:hypothetical protein